MTHSINIRSMIAVIFQQVTRHQIVFSTGLLFLCFCAFVWSVHYNGLINDQVSGRVYLHALPTAISALSLLVYESTNALTIVNTRLIEPKVNFYESRAFDCLAIFPAFGVIFALLQQSTRLTILNALSHGVLLIFIIHMRSTALYVYAALIMFYCVYLIYFLWHRNRECVIRSLAVIAVLGKCLVGMKFYQHVVFHPRYYGDMGNRTVWHNALMGMADTEIGQRLGLKPHDSTIANAVVGFLKESNDPRVEDEWVQKHVPERFRYPGFNVVKYERAAKDLYIYAVLTDPLETFSSFLKKGIYSMSFISTNLIKQFNYTPLLLIAALGCCIAIAWCMTFNEILPIVIFSFLLFCFSLVPSTVFYFMPVIGSESCLLPTQSGR